MEELIVLEATVIEEKPSAKRGRKPKIAIEAVKVEEVIKDAYTDIIDKPHNNYIEGVSQGHFFVLYDDKGNAKNQPAMCKDYFQDYFWACYLNKGVIKQYGYECKGEPLCDNYTLLVGFSKMKNGGSHICKYAPLSIIPELWLLKVEYFLMNLAIDLKLPIPKIRNHNSNKLFFVDFVKDWTKYPYLISLLTYCIRIGCYMTYSEFLEYDYNSNPSSLLNLNTDNYANYDIVRKKVIALKEMNGQLVEQPWEKYESSSRVHDYSGIVGFNF